jgi:hypothetical protein
VAGVIYEDLRGILKSPAFTIVCRTLTPDDDRTPGGHPLAVLRHAFWW